ncbi:MAG: hypothetical protein A3F14_05375 [Gammaproteobacteria bacterium RIFCSPHIGHO2_12_FULL_43_28]|nr:MAG: hypothetical protein A3F14_05375 [Gammaproteobacteria bacterium RIFCSPHIGHO2_12_FULL_43_28]
MSKFNTKIHRLPDGNIDINAWLDKMQNAYHLADITLLSKACAIAQKLSQGLTTFYGQSHLEQGLAAAEIIVDLGLDQESAAAAILCVIPPAINQQNTLAHVHLDQTIAKLVSGVQQTAIISTLRRGQEARKQIQSDKIRKLLLAMASDLRVVILKLAERLCVLREIKAIPFEERKRFAEEILDIYAPLANRLGIGQLKWELEDIAFSYIDPETYKTIAQFLAERRIDREKRIQYLISFLDEKLKAENLTAEITGRAKHIYSIYLKARNKQVDYREIYDQSALRILVPDIKDCYTALSVVHSIWQPIIKEFDDYIANPKPNGYRSIHTAVIDEQGKYFEIQIRTFAMHEEAERGIAAHWAYKEKNTTTINETTKVTYLRQLFDWHKEIATSPEAQLIQHTLQERVYVVSPAGDIIDLPQGATPLDFAYHIHSELGNRCRGAKVNKQIVPLSYALCTGDCVDIITATHGTPSRDWLSAESGYIKTARARSKIKHWFKQQALADDITEGKQLLERELGRLGITKPISYSVLAKQLQQKNEEALFASIGRGNIRIGQIIHVIQPNALKKTNTPEIPLIKSAPSERRGAILDKNDMLMRFAKCCKPIPGDKIIGYITQGRGISIHKENCRNINQFTNTDRLMDLNWDSQTTKSFSTDIKIIAQDEKSTLNDITALLANEKVDLLHFQSSYNKKQERIFIIATVQLNDIAHLETLLQRIKQLPCVIEVMRESSTRG